MGHVPVTGTGSSVTGHSLSSSAEIPGTTEDIPGPTSEGGSGATSDLTGSSTSFSSLLMGLTSSSQDPSATDTGPDQGTIETDSGVPSGTEGVITTDATATSDSTGGIESTAIVPSMTGSTTLPPATSTTTDSSVSGVTSTMTEPPEGFHVTTVSGHPEWTTNTWITTTESDSSEPSIVPVLVGCRGCGGRGSGIILFNSPPLTKVLFHFPGLPRFWFPCIPPGCSEPPKTPHEHGNDDEDEDEDDKTKSSTASRTCTEEVTASDCLVACTTYTGPADSSITPECTTTCTKTHTGCSVSGVTSTTSAEACGPSGDSTCRVCDWGSADTSEESDPEDLERRGLERRGRAQQVKKLGGCKFLGLPEFPEYPGGFTVLDNEADIVTRNSPLKDIKRWWRTTRDGNCVPTLNGPIPESQFPRGLPRDQGPSIDHVYEKSMLLDYFDFIIDPNTKVDVTSMKKGRPVNKISCNDMRAYGGVRKGTNWLQNLFDTYPQAMENTNPGDAVMVTDAKYFDDFIGMDQWTNGVAKQFLTEPKKMLDTVKKTVDAKYDVYQTTPLQDAQDWINLKFERLERIAIAMDMFNAPEAIAALENKNQRIYARLIDMDNNARNCMNDLAVKGSWWSFAERYKTFMTDRFTGTQPYSINQAVNKAKDDLIQALRIDLAEAVLIPGIPPGDLTSWNARLSNPDDPNRVWAVTSINWKWTYITKRDGNEGAAAAKEKASLPIALTVILGIGY
ncbi:hypothetical protein B0J15DRAFT_555380 [Fusarium solani]|uniref:Uncharacterized protein n=1 Tax=Fusarium solani TaxID=169388 RepID=A0A9P9JNT8_FUSSL|nr:uncharacterized protein B0J15DRAFT_555380 [Fusarium solani]KAH7231987.1 hypothetical protein B0J15DRAFT_555380 [Fusarium solani]